MSTPFLVAWLVMNEVCALFALFFVVLALRHIRRLHWRVSALHAQLDVFSMRHNEVAREHEKTAGRVALHKAMIRELQTRVGVPEGMELFMPMPPWPPWGEDREDQAAAGEAAAAEEINPEEDGS